MAVLSVLKGAAPKTYHIVVQRFHRQHVQAAFVEGESDTMRLWHAQFLIMDEKSPVVFPAAFQRDRERLRQPVDKTPARRLISQIRPAAAAKHAQAGARLKSSRRSSWALSATMIVLTDISSAPAAGDSIMPTGASTPAASGSATTL